MIIKDFIRNFILKRNENDVPPPDKRVVCDNITAYFKNGNLYKITPVNFCPLCYDRDRAYIARYFISDGIKYDMTDIASIASIPTPNYKYGIKNSIGVTGNLEYIVLRHAYNNNKVMIALLVKAINLMSECTTITYQKSDYLILPKTLYEIGEFEKGDLALEQIRNVKSYDFTTRKRSILERVLKDAAEIYNNDLIEIPALYTSCGECAKYQGRIYSVYGKDSRFPKLPKHILENGYIHNGCRHTLMNYFYHEGAKIEIYDEMGNSIEKDVIQYSNRPFVDNRTETEKNRYLKLPKPAIGIDAEEKKLLNFRQYCLIKYNNPDSAPKSFSAYMRKLNKQNKAKE